MLSSLPRKTAGRRAASVAALAALLGPAGLALADTIIYRSSANTAPAPPVEGTITKVEAGELYFTNQSGNVTHRPLEHVVQLKVKSEPNLTAAEQAYLDKNYEDAARAYARALDNTDKEWVKARALLRLVDAAAQAKQFPLSNRAFVELVKSNVAAAAKNQPADLPKDKPDQLNAAIADVTKALAGSLRPEQKEMLTTYQAKLLIAAGRNAEANRLLGAAPPPAPPAAPAPGGIAAAPGSPTPPPAARAGGVSADRALLMADQAVAAKNWPAAAQAIEGARASFTEPAQQAKALWLLAQAQEAAAGSDPVKLQDAAIAYMRVVAHFEDDKAAGTNTAAALLRTAAIEEKLSKPDEALALYLQVAKDPKFQGTAAAQEAAKKVAALKPKS